MVYVFNKTNRTYNPQTEAGKPYTSKVRAGSYNSTYRHLQIESQQKENTGTRQPTSVLEFAQPAISDRIHPTQKPVDLCEWLIRTFSNEGDTVLDPTMGGGSTGIACLNTGREFIGIELDQAIYEKAEKRLSDHALKVSQAKTECTQELFSLFERFLTTHQSQLKGEFVPPPESVHAPSRTTHHVRPPREPREPRERVWDRTELKVCLCGGKVRADNRARHNKTSKHIDWEASPLKDTLS